MNSLVVIIASLLMLGVLFTFNISSTLGQFVPSQQQSLAQPCENNGHGVVGTGKLTLSQSNRCIIIENNNPLIGTCPVGSVLQNGVCVPISNTCPIGTILQNGVCVQFTNPTQSAPVAVATVSPSSTVTGGTTVTLIGSSSFATTSGATIVSYSWVQTSGSTTVNLNGANTAFATFAAPTTSLPTTLTFSLTVTDSNGHASAPSFVTVTVR